MSAQIAAGLCDWIGTWRNPPPNQHLAYAFKFTSKDWRTHRGYKWPYPGEWTEPEPLDPTTCRAGGVHVAHSVYAAQTGGARATDNTLIVAYRSADAGPIEDGKQKVSTVLTVTILNWIRPGADLSGAFLSGANLYKANLSGADLSGAFLYKANLYKANLSRANLSGANLSGANLSGAFLSRANLYKANLSRAYLSRANLSGAYLSGAFLSGADLSEADLFWADLSGADLSRAYGRDDWDDLVKRGAIR